MLYRVEGLHWFGFVGVDVDYVAVGFMITVDVADVDVVAVDVVDVDVHFVNVVAAVDFCSCRCR